MDDNAEHVKVNRKNTKRIINKNSPERFKKLRANRYNPIIEFISKYVDKDAPLLDIGIREGKFLQVLKEVGFTSIHGVDVYSKGVERANRLGFEAKVADAQDFSFGKKFDTVTMSHVLEHCPDIGKTIQNVYDNVINDGGFFYVEVPPQKKEPVPTVHAHFYCFTSMDELLSFFDKSKWTVVEKNDDTMLRLLVTKTIKGD